MQFVRLRLPMTLYDSGSLADAEPAFIMNWQLLIPLLVTTCVAVVGWYAAHRLAASRDRDSKRREMITQHLIAAYRQLEPHWELDAETGREVERAIADIQLLGSPEQVRLAQDFATSFANNGTAQLDPLLLSLRSALRTELGLPVAAGGLKYLRIGGGPPRAVVG
jgi:hypothetical protein